jgi:hypothetical protein
MCLCMSVCVILTWHNILVYVYMYTGVVRCQMEAAICENGTTGSPSSNDICPAVSVEKETNNREISSIPTVILSHMLSYLIHDLS